MPQGTVKRKAGQGATQAEASNEIRLPAGNVFFQVKWLPIIAIALVSIAVYSNTLFMDFVWDDIGQIKENSVIKSLKNVPSMFTSEVWSGVKDKASPYYRPLFTLSLALDYFIWGEMPFGFHLTNVLLHAFASIAFYLLAVKLLPVGLAALSAGLIFAVHPVHAEAVAWISGRNEPLSALFMFISLYLYILFRERGRKPYIIFSILLFFLALLAKEIPATLPAIILLYEVCFRNEKFIQKLKWPIVYALVIIPYLMLRAISLRHLALDNEPLIQRLYTVPLIVIKYIQALILPANLKVFYDLPLEQSFLEPDVIVPALCLCIILSILLISFKHNRKLFFSLFWLFLTLTPVLNIIAQIRPALMADRYLYIPSAGFSLAAGIVFSAISNRIFKETGLLKSPTPASQQKIIIIAGIFIAGALSTLTLQRNYRWNDNFTFMARKASDAPHHYMARYDLGQMYVDKGLLEEAAKEFQYSLELNPDYFKAWLNLGGIYFKRGRFEEAARSFQNALKARPDYAEAHYNLGLVYYTMGQIDRSIQSFQDTLTIKPDYVEALNSLGSAYIDKERLDEAERYLKKALQVRPDFAEAYYNLGALYLTAGRLDDAAVHFRNTLTIKPEHADAYNNLGAIYLALGENDKAATQFQKALSISPDNKLFKKNLAKALAVKKK